MTMTLEEAIDYFEGCGFVGDGASGNDAWAVIKTALAELGTTPNTGSPKCLCETCQNEGCSGVDIPYKGKWTMHECDGFTKPLRAGA